MIQSIQEFYQITEELAQKASKKKKAIRVCNETGCQALGSSPVIESLKKELNLRDPKGEVDLKQVGCPGFCSQGPLLISEPDNTFYPKLEAKNIGAILDGHINGNTPVDSLLYRDPQTDTTIVKEKDLPFYAGQERLLLRHNGQIDPHNLDHYLAVGGYSAMVKAISSLKPTEVIEEVKTSGLRGRGGAGFPTSRKWEFCRTAKGDKKYLICNADEGDPGAFMDRSIIEGCPHLLIEGMIIAAYAIGAGHGIIYVREEYPQAVKTAALALKQARDQGFLGTGILGTGLDFDIEIRMGAGAFVCGEETALIASLEGKRGMPRPRPPFPAVKGYRGQPTNINNVETLANIPQIIEKGGKWYSSFGTEKSSGTKVFALAGDVKNTGLIEVAMGTTLRKIVFDIGGGIPGDKKFKGVLIGGPSGGFLTEEHLDLPLDYESVASVGAIIGSGGLIVISEERCIVDTTRFFMDFIQKESCGKCVPCRAGTNQMLEILTAITEGRGKDGDIEKLEELAEAVHEGSLCGLGQTAPNPVISSLRFYRYEYEEHLRDNECRAKVCQALYHFTIDDENCIGCSLCLKSCPQEAILGKIKEKHTIKQDLCVKCGICIEVCKFSAVRKVKNG